MDLKARKRALGFENNKSEDQRAHPQRLISVFVICLLESIIARLDSSEISIFYLDSVAEQVDLYLILSETLKTDVLASWPKYSMSFTMGKLSLWFVTIKHFNWSKSLSRYHPVQAQRLVFNNYLYILYTQLQKRPASF